MLRESGIEDVHRTVTGIFFFAVAGLLGCGTPAEDSAAGAEPIAAAPQEIIGAEVTCSFHEVGRFHGQFQGAPGVCTGTLIAPDMVLTAAHCVDYMTLSNASSMNWHFDINSTPGCGTPSSYPVQRVRSFGTALGADDLALAQLTVPVPSSVATPMSLRPEVPPEQSIVTALGHGPRETNPDGTCNMAASDGQKGYTYYHIDETIDGNTRVVGWPYTGTGCPGDSGGPVLLQQAIFWAFSWVHVGHTVFAEAWRHKTDIELQMMQWSSCPTCVACASGNLCYVSPSGAATLAPEAACGTEGTSLSGLDGLGCFACHNNQWTTCAAGLLPCGSTNQCFVSVSGAATLGPDGNPSHSPDGCAAGGVSLPGLDGLGCFVCHDEAWSTCAPGLAPCGTTNQCFVSVSGAATLGPDGNPDHEPNGCATEGTSLPGLDGQGCFLCTQQAWSSCTPQKITHAQNFDSLPAWSSSVHASWGSAATWSIGNSFLKATRSSPGSSAKVVIYSITPNQNYTISIYMKGASSSADYWVESAYRLGSHSASNFDSNPSAWTMVKKFSKSGQNGNGNVWVKYSKSINSGSNTQISVGFKAGNLSGTMPTARWDTLRIE